MIDLTIVEHALLHYALDMSAQGRHTPIEDRETTVEVGLQIGRGAMPPLLMLRAFEAACRTGSMRKAADDIGISHTVVSHHMRNLQAWMRCKLYDASPRGIELTPKGRLLFTQVNAAFDLIAQATAELRPSPQHGVLDIWCVPGLATRWLMPRLSEIEALLPHIRLSLHAAHEIDGRPGGSEITIGFAPFEDIPADARVLARPRMFPVVSPVWSAQHRLPDTIASLTTQPLIHEADHRQWRAWFDAHQVQIPSQLRGPCLSDAALGLDAAVAGQGIALTTQIIADNLLRAGQLVELFSSDVHLGCYFLSVSKERAHAQPVKTFTAWLERALAACERE